MKNVGVFFSSDRFEKLFEKFLVWSPAAEAQVTNPMSEENNIYEC